MARMVQEKSGDLAVNIVCLGNQTPDTETQAAEWAQRLQASVTTSDLAQHTIDDVWALARSADLVIMLDQPVDTYDHVETYQHYATLARYLKQFKPVLIAAQDAPRVWITDCYNNTVLDRIVEHNIRDTGVVVKLTRVTDLATFELQLRDISRELTTRGCQWVFYRAGPHEPLHAAATESLLQYPEFVLLNPGVFQGDQDCNIKQRIYQHWVDLYIRNRYERPRV